MTHPFQIKSKFAMLTVNNVYTDLPATPFQLSDGTWVMPAVPVPDLGIWKEWIGSIRMERLGRANLVLFREEPSDDPEILDAVHQRLDNDLSLLFYMLHLRSGIEVADGADLLCGSSINGVPGIRQMSQMPAFYQSKGWKRAPVTTAWLEDAISLRAGVAAMDAYKTQFRRVIRGLNTLFNGLKETGQDRLHQFVRSLEALILPDIGRTEKQFVHRCQTFTRAGDDTRDLLVEAFAMRSDTEHLNPWDEAVQSYPADEREDCAGTGPGKSSTSLVTRIHGCSVTPRSATTSARKPRWRPSGSCGTINGARCGENPSTSPRSRSFRNMTSGKGPPHDNRTKSHQPPGETALRR